MRAEPAGSATQRASAPVASLWTVLGVSLLFMMAIWRLGGRGLATIRGGLGGFEWAVLVFLTLIFVYGEGYRALDRRWVPGLIRRARALGRHGSLLLRLLGPLHGMALVGVERPRLLRAWAGTTAIVGAVLLVRVFPEPWRGIVDFAVAAALAWGLMAILRRVPAALAP